jgi:ubiquinone/menaquinone biosynthesis C-methylase UbiE
MTFRKDEWDQSFSNGRDYSPLNEVLLDELLKITSINQRQALDLGCGTGDTAIKFAKRGLNIVGVDWSTDALNKAIKRSEDENVGELVRFQEADLDDISKLQIPQGTIDIVISKLVIAFVKDKQKFCTHVKSLLTDTGVFILITPVLYDGYTYNQEDKPNIAVNYSEISSLLNNTFNDVTEFNHSYYGERGDLITFLLK